MPFFPTETGDFADKLRVIQSLRLWASRNGMSALTADTVTGHTFRVTGAQHLARMGIEISVIMLMARWRSPVVLHYAHEEPLNSITAK
eukprot:461555-Amphidinium_carterae.1